MGALTDDMTRLRGEVDAWRSARGDFIHNLQSSVASLRADFSNARGEMADALRSALGDFAQDLQSSVASLRAEFSADLAGAHRVWFGSTAPRAEKTFQKTKSKGKKGKG